MEPTFFATAADFRAWLERHHDSVSELLHEQRRSARFEPDQERRLHADEGAFAFFEAQPPSYRRAAIHWVISAKRPETRERRLTQLIECSAAGRPVPPLARRP
jgi:bacteriocin resistance YdeI/OmpD-like protein